MVPYRRARTEGLYRVRSHLGSNCRLSAASPDLGSQAPDQVTGQGQPFFFLVQDSMKRLPLVCRCHARGQMLARRQRGKNNVYKPVSTVQTPPKIVLFPIGDRKSVV